MQILPFRFYRKYVGACYFSIQWILCSYVTILSNKFFELVQMQKYLFNPLSNASGYISKVLLTRASWKQNQFFNIVLSTEDRVKSVCIVSNSNTTRILFLGNCSTRSHINLTIIWNIFTQENKEPILFLIRN